MTVETGTRARRTAASFDVERIRKDFPILKRKVHGKPLVYLDNAATTQKPASVLDAIQSYYREENSNIHRGVHALSELATQHYEEARTKIQQFIHAARRQEIVFVRGTTEAINLVASSYGRDHVGRGDEVVVTALEHHSNIVPWQMLCESVGASLRVVPITNSGEVVLEDFRRLLSERVKMVAVAHVSNALGTVNPIREMVAEAHRFSIPVLVDGAQAIAHLPVDVQDLECDFYAFSGHKMYGPTGIGVLYGKERMLETMRPYQGGGDMIKSVTWEKTTYNDLPYKFEAGTPNIAGTIGFGAAVDYLGHLDHGALDAHERLILYEATEMLQNVPGVRIIGTAREKSGVLSFVVEGVHPHDVGTILDREGIAVRTGHHCAQPVMDRFGIPATARASFALYNTQHEVEQLGKALRKVQEVFG